MKKKKDFEKKDSTKRSITQKKQKRRKDNWNKDAIQTGNRWLVFFPYVFCFREKRTKKDESRTEETNLSCD